MNWAEILGLLLSLAMVVCNIRVHVAAWPLACASSLLYALVFYEERLYGQAGLQIFFAAMALWGWRQWLRGADDDSAHGVGVMPASRRRPVAVALLVGWLLLALLLKSATDDAWPWWDALPTAGSIVATWMLARKYVENWLMWLAVNVLSIGLFAAQGMWPTVALYAVFAVMSLWGWKRWQAMIVTDSSHERVVRASS